MGENSKWSPFVLVQRPQEEEEEDWGAGNSNRWNEKQNKKMHNISQFRREMNEKIGGKQVNWHSRPVESV